MGAGQSPERKRFPLQLGGVLDEATTPKRVVSGGGLVGLTACENLIYRRFGAWGKRAGSTLVYSAVKPTSPPPSSSAPPPYTPPPSPSPPPDPVPLPPRPSPVGPVQRPLE